mgnify:CR=1 FL=1
MFLEGSVMKHGSILLSSMGLGKTFCIHLSMEISQLYIIGQEQTIKCNGVMQYQLDWEEDRMEDLAFI